MHAFVLIPCLGSLVLLHLTATHKQKFRLWALELEASWSVQLVYLQANMECSHVTQSGGYTNESCSVLGISTVHEQQRFQSTYAYIFIYFHENYQTAEKYSTHIMLFRAIRRYLNILSTSFFQF